MAYNRFVRARRIRRESDGVPGGSGTLPVALRVPEHIRWLFLSVGDPRRMGGFSQPPPQQYGPRCRAHRSGLRRGRSHGLPRLLGRRIRGVPGGPSQPSGGMPPVGPSPWPNVGYIQARITAIGNPRTNPTRTRSEKSPGSAKSRLAQSVTGRIRTVTTT